ncbi:TenA family protein [Tateyamaria sp. syn59]|uniref:TenA family protein n=1 Tax=Tateyamaria sp. syn59 TaxID=2576942 RepID=UPI0011BE5801|nr:TenA family protein [Tateyamaria sp. syn59]
MSFTEMLWSETAELQETILTMPFNTELAAGTLPSDTFQGYIIQDAHYLEGFARALALSASRAPGADAIAQLAGSAAGAIAVERQLHGDYMARFVVTPETFMATPPSQACDHYTAFLLRSAAVDPFPVAVTALLPCFWIYYRVGTSIHAHAAPENPYRAWIDTYAGEAFASSVHAMIALTDRLGAQADQNTQNAMKTAFAQSSWHEWMFWHSAYHRQGWETPSNPPRVSAQSA